MDVNLNELYRRLATDLLNSKCEIYGVRETLRWLIGADGNNPDYSKEELLALHFNEEDIDNIFEELRGED